MPGGYLHVSHFLTGEHMPWSRESGTLGRPVPHAKLERDGAWGAWQAALRDSFADLSDADVFGGQGESATLGLDGYWSSHASVQLDDTHGEISDRMEDVGGSTFGEGDDDILGVRFRVDF